MTDLQFGSLVRVGAQVPVSMHDLVGRVLLIDDTQVIVSVAGHHPYAFHPTDLVFVDDPDGSLVSIQGPPGPTGPQGDPGPIGPGSALNPGDAFTVGTSAVDRFALNGDRRAAAFTNYHLTAVIWVVRDATAVAGHGEPVLPMRRWYTDDFTGRVSTISDTASTPAPGWEV